MSTIKIVDLEQGTEVEREMTADELVKWEANKAAAEAEAAKTAATEAARAVLLDKLGITADEAKLLLGGN